MPRDSCRRRGLDETMECVSTEGAHQPPAESEGAFGMRTYSGELKSKTNKQILT